MIKEKVHQAVYSLLKSEPFYAHFILNSQIVYDCFGVPTAAACVVRGTPMLIFNSDFCGKLTDTGFIATIKHEVLHLVMDHVSIKPKDGLDKYVWNIAMDAAINQYIQGLPEGVITLESLRKATKKDLAEFETSEYYYKMLEDKHAEMRKAAIDTLDEHDCDVPGKDSSELAKMAVKRVAANAVKQAAGNAPKCVAEMLDQLNDAKLPWQTFLRNAVVSQISRKTQTTHKKINRRFPSPVPGKKRRREMTLGVCVDESGSVSQSELIAFMSEIQAIAKLVSKTYLVHADCGVVEVEDLSKVKFTATRKARGGTAYQPAIDECTKLKCNMIIYFGDFDTADNPRDPGVPFIWVGVGNSPAPANFGEVIRL